MLYRGASINGVWVKVGDFVCMDYLDTLYPVRVVAIDPDGFTVLWPNEERSVVREALIRPHAEAEAMFIMRKVTL